MLWRAASNGANNGRSDTISHPVEPLVEFADHGPCQASCRIACPISAASGNASCRFMGATQHALLHENNVALGSGTIVCRRGR